MGESDLSEETPEETPIELLSGNKLRRMTPGSRKKLTKAFKERFCRIPIISQQRFKFKLEGIVDYATAENDLDMSALETSDGRVFFEHGSTNESLNLLDIEPGVEFPSKRQGNCGEYYLMMYPGAYDTDKNGGIIAIYLPVYSAIAAPYRGKWNQGVQVFIQNLEQAFRTAKQ